MVSLVVEGGGRQEGRIWGRMERVGAGEDGEGVDRRTGEKIDMCEEEGERVAEGVGGKQREKKEGVRGDSGGGVCGEGIEREEGVGGKQREKRDGVHGESRGSVHGDGREREEGVRARDREGVGEVRGEEIEEEVGGVRGEEIEEVGGVRGVEIEEVGGVRGVEIEEVGGVRGEKVDRDRGRGEGRGVGGAWGEATSGRLSKTKQKRNRTTIILTSATNFSTCSTFYSPLR